MRRFDDEVDREVGGSAAIGVFLAGHDSLASDQHYQSAVSCTQAIERDRGQLTLLQRSGNAGIDKVSLSRSKMQLFSLQKSRLIPLNPPKPLRGCAKA